MISARVFVLIYIGYVVLEIACTTLLRPDVVVFMVSNVVSVLIFCFVFLVSFPLFFIVRSRLLNKYDSPIHALCFQNYYFKWKSLLTPVAFEQGRKLRCLRRLHFPAIFH